MDSDYLFVYGTLQKELDNDSLDGLAPMEGSNTEPPIDDISSESGPVQDVPPIAEEGTEEAPTEVVSSAN